MTDVNLAIRMSADASDAVAAADAASSAYADMGREVDAAADKAAAAGDRMGSVADSADNLGSSTSQAAGGLGDLGGALSLMPGPLGAVGGGMEALAPAVQGVTGAADLMSLAMNSTAVTTAKARAEAVAHAVATKAQTAVSKAAAVGQWALNAAMSANPIGIVVIAVAALVAGLVLAYNKSETFRNIVDGAMKGARAAVQLVVDKVSDIRDKVQGAMDKFPLLSTAVSTAKTLIVGYFELMTAPIRAVINLIQTVIDKVQWLQEHGGKLVGKALDAAGLRTSTTAALPATTTAVAVPVQTTEVSITVQGAIDPTAVANQLVELLRRYGVNVGAVITA